jgi:hypothetical protein
MLKWIIGYCLLSAFALWFLARSSRHFSMLEQAPQDFSMLEEAARELSMSEQATHDSE